MRLHFEIPGKPQVWKRTEGNGKQRYNSSAMVKAKFGVGTFANRAMSAARLKPFVGPCSLSCLFVFETPKSWTQKRRKAPESAYVTNRNLGDGDNLAKLIADSLTGIVYLDDSQISDTIIRKRYGSEPKTIVTVEPLIPLMQEGA